MIRKTIIVVLTLGAVGTVVLDIVSRQRPLIYFCDHIDQPAFWKLSTAQADRGKLRIGFESLGEFVHITEQDLPSAGFYRAPFTPRPLRNRLAKYGFYAGYYAAWSYGGGEDEADNYFHVKAMSRTVGFGVPAWFLFILVASYPALVFIRSIGWRRRYRKKHGRCVQCGYNLEGNVSGVCPECGTEYPKASNAN